MPSILLPLLLLAFAGAAPLGAQTSAMAEDRPTGFPARCAPGEVQVMLLGTYHFANPGLDDIKTEVDDVLAPRRQRELEDIAARLARWRPDQVAVEARLASDSALNAAFRRYTAGEDTLPRSETYQVGFRLAKRLGHPRVYPIDHGMPIGNDSVGALYARRPDLKRASDSITAAHQIRADAGAPAFRARTIVQQLREANTDGALHGGNSEGMFGVLLPLGEGNNYGGPQVLAKWYERNLHMIHNLYGSLHAGTRRVLVIAGSGHVPPLRNLLDEAPQFCPVSPLPYLR